MDNLANNYSYDAEGRQITVKGNATTFDAFNRAIEIQSGIGSYAQVVYAPSGQKFAFMNGTALIKYIDPMVMGMAAVHNGPNGTPVVHQNGTSPSFRHEKRFPLGRGGLA